MPKAKSYGAGNKYPKVVTRPTKANRSMNKKVSPSLSPTNPNRRMNKNVSVKPSTYGKGY
jgi:hypothetical protein